MHTYHPFGIVGNKRQTMLHRVEARLATIGNLIDDLEIVLLTEIIPIFLLRLRQHEDNLQVLRVLAEPLKCAHQDRLPAYRQELLRNVTSHAQAFTACYYDYVITIHFYAIKCLKRMPSAIWSEVFLSTSWVSSS